MKKLSDLMKNRPPPSPESFAKAFGGTKSVEPSADRDAPDEGFRFDDVEVLTATPDALLVLFSGGTKEWVPRSQVKSAPNGTKASGDYKGHIVVSTWLAKQRGWI